MTIEQIGTLVNSGGVVLLLVAALYGGYKRWWVYGASYAEVVADRDQWKALAMRGVGIAEKSAATVEVLTKNGTPK